MKSRILLMVGLLVIINTGTTHATQNISGKDFSSWARPAITALAEKEMLPPSLINDRSFKENITREEFAELMVMYYENLSGPQSSSGQSFTDTNNPMLAKAANLGIVAGNPDGRFNPGGNITREQVAAIIRNTELKLGRGVEGSSANLNRFSDRNRISSWARPAVSYGVENKLIGGNADGTFNPTGFTTKEQAMAMVNNMLQSGGTVTPTPTPPPVQSGNVITGPAAEQALRNIIAERNYKDTTIPHAGPIGSLGVKSFQHVKNGESFVLEGQTISGVSFEKSGDWVIITPRTNGKYEAGTFISVFGSDGTNSRWLPIEGNNGQFGTRLKQEQIKVVVLMTNNSNYVLIDIN